MEANEDLICGICLDLADMAVETACCHQLFCEPCLREVCNCPMCTKLLEASPSPSYTIRRIIGKLLINCELCSSQIERGNKDSHLEVCPERLIPCVVENCSFKAKKDYILQHLTSEHVMELTSSKYKLGLFTLPQNVSQNTADLIGAKVNSTGNAARLGSTGKYYCGGHLGFMCGCCNGCGPTNGCNCLPCFKLDLSTRKLPPGFFINSEGHPIRRGSDTAFHHGSWNYYCGRKCMARDRNTDGWCGPTDGDNCESCRVMQMQLGEGGCYNEVTCL